MKNSIRRRLLVGLTVTTVSLWLVVIGATYFGANREVGALFDTQLEQSARVALRTMFGLPAERGDESEEAGGQYRKNLAIQVWDGDGEIIIHSRNAPDTTISEIKYGFADSMIDGEPWRTYAFRDKLNDLTIRVGEPYLPRDYLTRHVVIQTLYPIILGLPIVTLLIWIVVSRGLMPMRRLAADMHRRNPDHLESITAPYAPAEAQPLITELNRLLGRLKHKIDNERHFVGNAAHELRTPLSGLKAQAEVALGARNDSERTRALNNILIGVDRAGHLVNQLLTLSRLDESASINTTPVNLAETVRQVILDTLDTADRRQIELSFDMPPAERPVIHGDQDALYMLIRNLVDNAVKFSPDASSVSVSLTTSEDRVILSVRDQGPGIPATEREKVFDRFHRQTDRDIYGTGLGLSIVKRVVELHQGDVVLDEAGPAGGLKVTVTFKLASPSDSRDTETLKSRKYIKSARQSRHARSPRESRHHPPGRQQA